MTNQNLEQGLEGSEMETCIKETVREGDECFREAKKYFNKTLKIAAPSFALLVGGAVLSAILPERYGDLSRIIEEVSIAGGFFGFGASMPYFINAERMADRGFARYLEIFKRQK